MLGLAFDAGDVTRARALVKEVRQKPADWKLDSTVADLARSVAQQPEGPDRAALAALLDSLKALLPAAPLG